MKKVLALVLVVVMVMVATSALAVGNLSEIEGLPERPEVPSMKTKLNGTIQTVTLDGPVSWMSYVRNWSDYIPLEFDENFVATYDTAGQTAQPGFAQWGWAGDSKWTWTDRWSSENTEDVPEYTPYSFHKETWGDMGGYHEWEIQTPAVVEPGFIMSYPSGNVYTDIWEDEDGVVHEEKWLEYVDEDIASAEYDEELYAELQKKVEDIIKGLQESDDEDTAALAQDAWYSLYYDEDGRVDIIHEGHSISGGTYDMGYAYHGADANGVEVKYALNGNLVAETLELTDANFFGSEEAPTKTKVTWSSSTNMLGAPVVYISEIAEEYADGSTKTYKFSMNGKVISVI